MVYQDWTDKEKESYEKRRIQDGILDVIYDFKNISPKNPAERAECLLETMCQIGAGEIAIMAKLGEFGKPTALVKLEQAYVKYLIS